ncbi:MAG: HAD hydrolase-like protein [Deltaproteobacteria bacterium]|nr:HAD hydrolase-like protein [Deltaproteobacteria bacterium]
MPHTRALALDFDGVICDSAREAFHLALQSARECLGPPAQRAFPKGAEQNAALWERFVELLPLGNRADDYGVCLLAIATNTALPGQDDYDHFRAGLDPAALRAFRKRLYQLRARWERQDPSGWRALLPAYPGICELLRRRAGEVHLAIATAKDRRAVRQLLETYGIGDLFPKGCVLDKESGPSKRAHIAQIAERLACPPAQITFVDDKVSHLLDVSGLGARCLLAAWGYNGPRESRIAQAAGFPVCQLRDFEAQAFP